MTSFLKPLDTIARETVQSLPQSCSDPLNTAVKAIGQSWRYKARFSTARFSTDKIRTAVQKALLDLRAGQLLAEKRDVLPAKRQFASSSRAIEGERKALCNDQSFRKCACGQDIIEKIRTDYPNLYHKHKDRIDSSRDWWSFLFWDFETVRKTTPSGETVYSLLTFLEKAQNIKKELENCGFKSLDIPILFAMALEKVQPTIQGFHALLPGQQLLHALEEVSRNMKRGVYKTVEKDFETFLIKKWIVFFNQPFPLPSSTKQKKFNEFVQKKFEKAEPDAQGQTHFPSTLREMERGPLPSFILNGTEVTRKDKEPDQEFNQRAVALCDASSQTDATRMLLEGLIAHDIDCDGASHVLTHWPSLFGSFGDTSFVLMNKFLKESTITQHSPDKIELTFYLTFSLLKNVVEPLVVQNVQFTYQFEQDSNRSWSGKFMGATPIQVKDRDDSKEDEEEPLSPLPLIDPCIVRELEKADAATFEEMLRSDSFVVAPKKRPRSNTEEGPTLAGMVKIEP